MECLPQPRQTVQTGSGPEEKEEVPDNAGEGLDGWSLRKEHTHLVNAMSEWSLDGGDRGRLERLGVHKCNGLKELAKLAGCVVHGRDWGGRHLSTGKNKWVGGIKTCPVMSTLVGGKKGGGVKRGERHADDYDPTCLGVARPNVEPASRMKPAWVQGPMCGARMGRMQGCNGKRGGVERTEKKNVCDQERETRLSARKDIYTIWIESIFATYALSNSSWW